MAKISQKSKQILTKERGAVAVTAALTMFILLGFAAFAIDFGYVYGINNKIQNAADSAALAGASVLFSNNQLCTSSHSPYYCCTGLGTGSCVPEVVDVDNVTQTALALADLNKSGGDDTTVTVEIGHYAFASIWGSPGTFNVVESNIQLSGWENMSFSDLNDTTDFINAVKVTVQRKDVPRFFSRIWSSSDLSSTVQATAYIGFAGYLAPGEVDEPIAICEQSITENGAYKCNVGTMLNDNTQTAAWTDFDQDTCGTAFKPDTTDLICDGNPDPIIFGKGMSTTNGTISNQMSAIYDCWLKGKFDSDDDGVPDTDLDTDGDGKPDRPWQLKLPVIDCSGNDNCRTVVGAVVVNVVWINENNSPKLNKPDAWVPSNMYNPLTGDEWSCSDSPTDCWDDFVEKFNLQNNNLTGDAEWDTMALYFLPDCDPQIPAGGTGGENFGIMARWPKLVK